MSRTTADDPSRSTGAPDAKAAPGWTSSPGARPTGADGRPVKPASRPLSRIRTCLSALLIWLTAGLPAAAAGRRAPEPPGYHFADAAVIRLVEAALTGDLDAARREVEAGADPNALGNLKPGSGFGFSPLHYALATGSTEAVRVLGAVGADPEREMPEMGMPLLYAIMLHDEGMLAALLDLKPVARLTERTQQHLLFESARRDAVGCLDMLLRRGVPLDVKDAAGYTLMLRSIEMGRLDLTLRLVRDGASVSFYAASGVSPAFSIQDELENSTKRGSPKETLVLEIIRLMRERGAMFPAPSPQSVREQRKARQNAPVVGRG